MALVIRVPFHPVQWLSIEARLFATDVVISLCLLMLWRALSFHVNLIAFFVYRCWRRFLDVRLSVRTDMYSKYNVLRGRTTGLPVSLFFFWGIPLADLILRWSKDTSPTLWSYQFMNKSVPLLKKEMAFQITFVPEQLGKTVLRSIERMSIGSLVLGSTRKHGCFRTFTSEESCLSLYRR